MKCAGDKSVVCGAGNRLSVTADDNWRQTLFARQSYASWSLVACYKDNVNGRTLPARMANTVGGAGNMTVANCLDACRDAGLLYCGLEYYQECYGGAAEPADALVATSGSGSADPLLAGCNYACKGNGTEACGGANRVLVYVNNGTVTV